MLRIGVTICALLHLVTALPQRGVQIGLGGPPRPVTYGGGPTASPSAQQSSPFSPSFTQQLSFGPQSSQLQRAPQIRANTYQSPQPILISQANPSASPATPTAFASFPGASPFSGGRQILTLRSPAQSADEDEYEYEDDDEPQIHSRPNPSARPVQATRAPVRVASPSPSYGSVQGRFPSQQQQQQPSRQRQPIQQGIPLSSSPQQQQPPRGVPQSAPRPGGQFGIDGRRSRLTTPPPVQTVNRFMRQNDDGSMTWGYENEDGTFKEETLGADCVVRGKYGYVDPEGNKREYEYQTGNPCDPNKKDQEEELEDEDLPDGPSRPQQLAGVLNARPRPVQRRPVGGGGQIPQYQGQPPQYQ